MIQTDYLHIFAWVFTRFLHFQTLSELHNLQIVKRKYWGPSLDLLAFLVLFSPSPGCTPSNSPKGKFVSILSVCLTLQNPYTLISVHVMSIFKFHFSFGSFSPNSLTIFLGLFLEIIVTTHLNHFPLYYLILPPLVQNKNFLIIFFGFL